MQLSEEQMVEVRYMVTQLQTVLAQDNEARKGAEAELNKIKEGDPDKYGAYLTSVIMHPEAPQEIKSLAAVILRRSLGTVLPEKKQTLWEAMSAQAKEFLKTNLLQTIRDTKTKDLMRKLSNLLVEVAGGMFEENEEVWQDLLGLVWQFVASEDDMQVEGALGIFNGLFSYIIDHLNQHQNDLVNIFRKTLQHKTLDIRLAALQAVSNYLQTVEQKDTKSMTQLIPDMYSVIRAAAAEDDEVVLQDAFIEFNEIAEIEPKFFQSKFKEIFQNTADIVGKADFTNPQIRQQPIEFYVTVVERVPSIVKKDDELLKNMIELIFKLMVDIDADIEDEWLRPKEGFNDSGQADEGEDNVNFGKSSIDKIISAVGESKCLPLLSGLVEQMMSHEDWRYKNAALMAFSQVGEYIEDIKNISAMMPAVLEHLKHPNPKVRHASLHCIGQISDDMTEDFQEEYGADVLPALIVALNDPVPRVSAHCCSAITNFMDGASEELIEPHMQTISPILANLMKTGISIQKENSVTAFASTAVVVKEKFNDHFAESIDLLLGCLNENSAPEYKQFRAQTIEAITLICSGVSDQTFATKADVIIQSMLYIQKSNMEANDPQRSYLLSAWQRICLIMKKDFAPYLPEILPPILSMATLKPQIGLQGAGAESADIADVLKEMGPEGNEKKANIMTDEIEEKDSAIQMLTVFIEELGGGFAQYIEQVSEILLGLTQFFASENIRNSSAGALPALIKCAKEAAPNDIATVHTMAKAYSNNLIEAMETETETDCLIAQAQALKEIVEEAGNNLLQPESVNQFYKKVLEFVQQSENRIKENTKYESENTGGAEEDQLDEEDLQVLKEENKTEQELQVSLAECLGILFKTHKEHCRELVQVLHTTVLPAAAADGSKHKQKLLLFILDDMVEFLGPDFLGPLYPQVCNQIVGYSNSKHSAIRQASVYGIGMIAQHGGAAFAGVSQVCLEGIKAAIEFPMDAATKEKKGKLTQHYHAKDNAVAALGKILKHQSNCADPELLLNFWLTNLPLTHDMEEAKVQNEFLAESLLKAPATIIGANGERLEQVVVIFGEICWKKQSDEDTLDMLSVVIANLSQDATAGPQFQALCEAKLSEECRGRLTATYNKCNEEVRAKVAAKLAQ